MAPSLNDPGLMAPSLKEPGLMASRSLASWPHGSQYTGPHGVGQCCLSARV